MTITCLVIRKVTGNSTVTYDGRTQTPQAAPRRTQARATIETAVLERTSRAGAAQWARDHVMIVTPRAEQVQNPAPAKQVPSTPAPRKITPAPESKEAKPGTDAYGELFEAMQAACEVAGGRMDPVEFKPAPEQGIPVKGEKYHIVQITSSTYNGLLLPVPDNELPAYLIANKRGEIMQAAKVEDIDLAKEQNRAPVLTWAYRGAHSNTDENPNAALNLIQGDLKRLKTWVNWKPAKVAPEQIRLNVKRIPGSSSEIKFQVLTGVFLAALKDLPQTKESRVEICGYSFPVKELTEISKLANDTIISAMITPDHAHEITKPDKTAGETTTPAIILRHGYTKTTIYGTQAGNSGRAIHCAIN